MTSRHTALAGGIFVPAFVVGLLLVDNPDGNSSAATFAAWYGNHAHRVHLILSGALLCVAALAWVVFVTGLRERLSAGPADRVAGSAATITAALLGVCGALMAAIPAGMTFGSAPAPGADAARFLPMAAYLALGMFAMPAAGLAIATICWNARRAGTLPPALAWAGIVAAVLLLGSVEFFPMLALVLWVLAAIVVLVRRPLQIPLPAAA